MIIPDDGYSEIDEGIIEWLIGMFDNESQIIKAFKMVRDRFREYDFLLVRLRLL